MDHGFLCVTQHNFGASFLAFTSYLIGVCLIFYIAFHVHTCLSHWTTTLHEDGMMLGVPVSHGLSIHRPLEFSSFCPLTYSNFRGIQMGRAAYKDVFSKEVDKWGFGGEQAC